MERKRRTWRTLSGIWMGLILVGSYLPNGNGEMASGAAWHILGYGVLSGLLTRWIETWPAFFVAWGYGGAMEAMQWILPTRSAEVGDLVANAVGAAIGLIASWGWLRLKGRYSSKTTS